MTEDQVFELLERISVRWPNWRIPTNFQVAVDEYMWDLEPYDYEEVIKVYRSFREQKFAPTLSEVIAILNPEPMGEPWMVRRSKTA